MFSCSRVYLISLFFIGYLLGESNIENLFTDGSIQGELKLFYYDIDKQRDDDAYANAMGGYLKYSTDINQTIYASIRYHISSPLGSGKNREDTALFSSEDSDSLLANSEAYIGWRTDNSILKVGNLMLNTPMINDDRSRIVPWSYRGVAYTRKLVYDTKVQLYHITDIRSYTSDEYTKQSASGSIGSSGLSMLGLHYDGLSNLKLHSYYYYAPDLYSTLTAEANYELLLDEESMFCFSFQYFKSGGGGIYNNTEDKNGGDDIDLLSTKVGYYSDDLTISIAYSQNFGVSGIVKGYGGLTKVYTTSMIANGRGNYKPETWMLKSSYEFLSTSWGTSEVAMTLTSTRTHDNRGDEFDAYYLHWKHKFDIDTSLFIRYENLSYYGDKSDAQYFRIIASHRF